MSKTANVFVDGAISPDFIATSIAKHTTKINIGAHAIFLGQVRADETPAGVVEAIVYETYMELAMEKLHQIREQMFAQYQLTCMHIYHSLGKVNAGEICLFVFTSSKHRNDATTACNHLVELIKKEVPIWGKEITTDGQNWKQNT